MSKKVEKRSTIVGKKFNRLTVLDEYSEMRAGRKRRYLLCKCECGNEIRVRLDGVLSERTKSCGCYATELLKERKTHGMSNTRFYHIWQGMKYRCQNVNNTAYKYYGGRGIKLSDEWNSFEKFKEDMYSEYKKQAQKYGEKNISIDRINSNGDYEKNNCRWIELKNQWANTRKRSDNKSGYQGVSWFKRDQKWRAFITINGKHKHIGYFTDKKDAIKARRAYEAFYYRTLQYDGNVYEIELLKNGFYAKKETERAV